MLLLKSVLIGTLIFAFAGKAFAGAGICDEKTFQNYKESVEEIVKNTATEDPEAVFPTLQEAIAAKASVKKPVKNINTNDANTPLFPSYSNCSKSFFRVATVDKATDQKISADGWKSGWARRSDELQKMGQNISDDLFDALPASIPFEERIVQYVRVKNKHSPFPKHSTVVGVLENPVRTLSVGYHTGYNAGMTGNYMRMDEIEVGPCAKAPSCQKLSATSSEEVFKNKKLTPRYSVDGEWAIDTQVPRECVVATYRIKFQKVDSKCYSDVNGNCGSK